MNLSIVIVNYNGGALLKKCLGSIYKETKGISFEIIVVDNASIDGSCNMMAEEFPRVTVIPQSVNRGFAAANNIGIREAVGDYVLLLNPDTEVLDGALQKTTYFMEQNPKAAVVGCKLLFPNRSLQPSVSTFPSTLNALLEATFLYLLVPSTRIVGRSGFRYFDYCSAQEVDIVMGSFFMIRRSVLSSIGLLDEQFFMYSEETDYCYRVQAAGQRVWFIPEACVIHYWSGVSSPTLRGILWLHLSQRLFLQKHYHGFEKHAIIALRYLGALVRVVVFLVAGCLSLNKRIIAKSYYFANAIYKMLTTSTDYRNAPPAETSRRAGLR